MRTKCRARRRRALGFFLEGELRSLARSCHREHRVFLCIVGTLLFPYGQHTCFPCRHTTRESDGPTTIGAKCTSPVCFPTIGCRSRSSAPGRISLRPLRRHGDLASLIHPFLRTTGRST